MGLRRINKNNIIAIDTKFCDCSKIAGDVAAYCDTVLTGYYDNKNVYPNSDSNGILLISFDTDDEFAVTGMLKIKNFIIKNVKKNKKSCCWVRISDDFKTTEIIGDISAFDISMRPYIMV